MARCSLAKPSCTTTATPHLFRCRRCQIATSATSASAARLPALRKPGKQPPPLLSRPKLPIPTPTSTTTPTGSNKDSRNKPSHEEPASAPPSSSGAGDVLRLLDTLCLPPDEDTYISLLRDCTDAAEVAVVYAHIVGRSPARGHLPLPLANRILLSYASYGDLVAARRVFDGMPAKNAMAWATMVSAYSDRCLHRDALRLFAQMCREACSHDDDCYAHAIVAVLRSCAHAGDQWLSRQVHALIVKLDRVRGEVGRSLMQLYCEIGGLHISARQVLAMMMQHHCEEPVPEAVWTSLITSCHRNGLLHMAIDVFRDMVSACVPRSSFSLSGILAVIAESSEIQDSLGQQVHADAVKCGVDTDQFVGSGLVHMYAKQGQLPDAARAFEAISGKPDAVCWSVMAMAYARGGQYREATRVMYQMKAAGVNPSETMLSAVRSACFR